VTARDVPSALSDRPPRSWAYGLLWTILLLLCWWRAPARQGIQDLPGTPRGDGIVIDLNRDPWERLLVLEGIGEKLAQRIVAARTERKGFANLEEVMQLPGVPDRPFQSARGYLKLGPYPESAASRD